MYAAQITLTLFFVNKVKVIIICSKQHSRHGMIPFKFDITLIISHSDIVVNIKFKMIGYLFVIHE